MAKPGKSQVVPVEFIERRIYSIRGQKVMLSHDLAELYEVTTFNLNKAVQRNLERFPEDFMFQLTNQEVKNLKFQIGISSSGYGGRRHLPYAFTEQGVAMLSSVLNSDRAIQVNIAIMRAFVQLRHMLASNKELARKLEELEKKVGSHDQAIVGIFKTLHELANPPKPPPPKPTLPKRRPIGFTANLDEEVSED